MSPSARLHVTLGDHQVVLEPGASITVGRHRQCWPRTSHERVSRFHGVIRSDNDGWWFTDAGSLNGTYDGGELVTQRRIDHPTVLRLGHAAHGPLLELRPDDRPPGDDAADEIS